MTFGIGIGKVGWGIEFSSIRLGWLHLWFCRGSVFLKMVRYHSALGTASLELRKMTAEVRR